METIKDKIEAKTKELEDLKKRLPTNKDKTVGQIKHGDPLSLWMRIEELEEEIEGLKQEEKRG